ncbi:hypothetical protein [uncultured Limosilactobacillus sp.]|uniref:hypothetical protein n=1 Tax=uncultured Limosilactobacillus sp. TaxID=2837629 RepID=UPI0025F59AD7|nr:hypothetical protein [uncultured Limosilactobacillus sp.]
MINDSSLLTSLVYRLEEFTNGKLSNVLKKVKGVSAGGMQISFDNHIDPSNEIANHVMKLMQIINHQNKFVVVAIDEVTNDKVIHKFAQIFNELKRQEMPIFVLMTGLPGLILDVKNEEKLTFLLRSEQRVMKPLQVSDIAITYRNIFQCSSAVASKMAQMVQGYSYAFQLLGYLVFDKSTREEIPVSLELLNNIKNDYLALLFDNAYTKIFDELSTNDQKYLVSIFGNKRLSEVAKDMHQSLSYVSQYRRRAISRHLVAPATYGKVKYTLPFFREFIQETQNPDSMYYLYLDEE